MAGLSLVLAVMTPSSARGEETPGAGFEVSLTTEKATYRAGEPITMMLRVSSRTREEVVFHFSSAQRFDFAIRDARGGEVWRWSDGRIFAQALGTEAIGPVRPELTYRAEFRGNLAPGWYRLEAALAAKDRPLSGALALEVQ